MKRALLVNSSYLAPQGGDKEILVQQARTLKKNGYQVDILTGDYNKDKYPELAEEFTILHCGIDQKRNLIVRHLLTIYCYLTKKLDFYDLLVVHDFPAGVILFRGGKFRTKIYHTCGPNHLFYYPKNYISTVNPLLKPLLHAYISLLSKLDKWLAKKYHQVITISKFAQEKVKKYYQKTSTIVYPGVTLPIETKPKWEKFLYTPSRIIPEKRIDTIVKAMKFLPDYELLISGKGQQETEIKELIEKERLINVKMLGWVSEQELHRLYNECYCCIYIPFECDFGMVPVEAQAHGKMAIGSNEGGLQESIIQQKTGILLDHVTPQAIAEAVRMIEKIDPLKQANPCYENAKLFCWEKVNLQFISIVEETFSKKHGY